MLDKNFTIRIAFSLLLAISGLDAVSQIRDKKVYNAVASNVVPLTINLSKHFQTIENFGASDTWSCQFVGNWPEKSKNEIADLLFSTKLSNTGKPEGIGLSMWRFNIGAGSAQQGRNSNIRDEWRRAESFFDGQNYNWDLQAGQLWFLEAAKKRGLNQFLAFTNSPPVHLTTNGKAFATAGKPNLRADKFDAFAQYLVKIVEGVKEKTGILFNYLSPVNEPQWEWSDGGQEGTPFDNSDVSGIVKSINKELIRAKLNTKIAIPEAGQYNFLYSDLEKPDKGNQINAFFNPSSPHFIGDLQTVDKVILAHSYFTTSPYIKAVSLREELNKRISSIQGLRFWQSEYCILGDNEGEIKGEKRDPGMKSALYLARVIHTDLVYANASAWQWWTAVSAYDYKDGLVYVDKNKENGKFYQSKMLWALGNYSRFIRPGAVRIDVNAPDLLSVNDILVSSYLDKKTDEVITVLINQRASPVKVSLTFKAGKLEKQRVYVTSEEQDLQPDNALASDGVIELKASSVTTVVSKMKV